MRQAGTVMGMPAPIEACRAGFCPWPAVTAYNKFSILVSNGSSCWIYVTCDSYSSLLLTHFVE